MFSVLIPWLLQDSAMVYLAMAGYESTMYSLPFDGPSLVVLPTAVSLSQLTSPASAKKDS